MNTVHFCSTARASPFVLIRVIHYSDLFEMWVMMVTIVNWKVLIQDGWGFCQVAIPSKLRALSLVLASGLSDAGNSWLLFSCSCSSVGVVSLCFIIWFLNTSHCLPIAGQRCQWYSAVQTPVFPLRPNYSSELRPHHSSELRLFCNTYICSTHRTKSITE
jgi:hypothetical protein